MTLPHLQIFKIVALSYKAGEKVAKPFNLMLCIGINHGIVTHFERRKVRFTLMNRKQLEERQMKLNFQDGVRGRYSVAARDIGPGEVLLVEGEPAAWFLSWDKASTNCQFCCRAIQKQRKGEDRWMKRTTRL